MDCAFCKITKISPNLAPYGGFLCSTGHMQCSDCNTRHNGQCGMCGNATDFIVMIQNSIMHNLAAAQATIALSAVGQPPSAPLLSSSNTSIAENPSLHYHSQSMFAEIEVQSNISQEHLSMNDSKDEESVSLNTTLESPAAKINLYSMEGSLTNTRENAATILTNKQSSDKNSDCGSPNKDKQMNAESAQKFVLEDDASTKNRDLQNTTAIGNLNFINAGQVTYPEVPEVSEVYDNFVFQEDSDDLNLIHISEIRFMDSTESMNNLLKCDSIQKSKARNFKGDLRKMSSPPSANNVAAKSRMELQRGPLSTKHLQEHDSRNTGHSNEVVEHYLQVYGPLATYHFPSYNCQQPHCDFNGNIAPMHSISVSTASEPSLRSVQPDTTTTDVGLHKKFGNQNYVVMHATGVGNQATHNTMVGLDKFGRPSLDMCMQRILKTFQEDPKTPKLEEKLDPEGDKIRKLSNYLSDDPRDGHPANVVKQQTNRNVISANGNEVFTARLLNTHRAVYQPIFDLEPLVLSFKNLTTSPPAFKEPPPVQFQSISCSTSALQEIKFAKANLLSSTPAVTRHMPPLPIKCPESKCSCMIFISDLHKHFVMDHSQLPLERITPFQCKNLLIDPRLDHCGISKCHYLYLLRDKITGLGSSQYKDFLPLLVMTSRISLAQMCGINEAAMSKVSGSLLEFMIIWITGIVPEEFPISVSLTVWPRTGTMPSCHLVYSGDMYSIRNSQKVLDVVHSGQMLMLSAFEVDRLTKGFTEMLNMQLVFH